MLSQVRTVVRKWLAVKRLQRQINQASDRRTSVATTSKSKAILTETTATAITEHNGCEERIGELADLTGCAILAQLLCG